MRHFITIPPCAANPEIAEDAAAAHDHSAALLDGIADVYDLPGNFDLELSTPVPPGTAKSVIDAINAPGLRFTGPTTVTVIGRPRDTTTIRVALTLACDHCPTCTCQQSCDTDPGDGSTRKTWDTYDTGREQGAV